MPARPPPHQPSRKEGGGLQKGGKGWQKPTKPPKNENRPPGLPPKKPEK